MVSEYPCDREEEAAAAIAVAKQAHLAVLRRNGVSTAAGNALEQLLAEPGTLARPSLLVRCWVRERTLQCRVVVEKDISRPRLEAVFLPYLSRLVERTSGAWDCFVLLSDSMYVASSREAEILALLDRVPLLRCDRRDDDPVSTRALLIPDYLLQEPAYAREYAQVHREADRRDFATRDGRVLWRGRLSGPAYPTIDNCMSFPRYRLLLQSLRYPSVIDARLTGYDNLEGSAPARALKRQLEALFGLPSPRLPAHAFVAGKYLISLDGAVSAWKRVPTALATGSVLILQHQWAQYFYPALLPWVHYVPVHFELEDLLDRHAWLEANPDEARAIGQRGRAFSRSLLHPDRVECYVRDVLRELAALWSG